MARSLGLSLQPDGFAFALVEGSAKRYAVKAHGAGGLDEAGEEPAKALGRSVARALKEAGIGRVEHVVVSLPSLQTVLRELNLPFAEREKVREVLKFEVESDLYHRSIEEVVCDFVELRDDRATPTLLVAAVPKADIAAGLEVAAAGGHDPSVMELDLGALLAALHGQFPAAPPAAAEGEAAAGEHEAFLHIGPFGSLLLVAGPRGIRAARSVRLGWREVARVPSAAAAATGRPQPVAQPAEAGAEGQAAAEEPPARGPLFGADPALLQELDGRRVLREAKGELLSSLVRRLCAEVRRGLAAVAATPVARLHVLGAELPGLEESLQSRLGVPTARLRLAGADPAVDPLALGAALRGLGLGASRMNLRQEEYRHTRGLERLEGALTFALFGLIAWLLVSTVVQVKHIQVLKSDVANLVDDAVRRTEEYNASLDEMPEDARKEWFIPTALSSFDALDRLGILRDRVQKVERKLDELVGEAGVEMPQSCLEAWRLVTEVLAREMQAYPERWMLEGLDLTTVDGTPRRPAHVLVKARLTLFGDDLTVAQKWDALQAAFRALGGVLTVTSEEGLQAADAAGARTGELEIQLQVLKEAEP